MSIVLMCLLIILFAALAFCFYMLFRNQCVFACSRKLLEQIHIQSQRDIEADKDFTWRYEHLHKYADYDYLFTRFWVWPIENLIKDKNFLLPHEEAMIVERSK